MRALTIHGPWAYYERHSQELTLKVSELEAQLTAQGQQAEELSSALACEKQKVQDLTERHIPALHNDHAAALGTAGQLAEEVQSLREQLVDAGSSQTARIAELIRELEQMRNDNKCLRGELAKQIHIRHATASKVEQVRRTLGMTAPEAEMFVKDMDELRAASQSLTAEVAALTADKAHLQQQCESRSNHAMTLIAENKRLIEQAADLRRQVVQLDQSLWRVKQELAALTKQQAKTTMRKEAIAAAHKARPAWQDAPHSLSPQGRLLGNQRQGQTQQQSSSCNASRETPDALVYCGTSRPNTATSSQAITTSSDPPSSGKENKKPISTKHASKLKDGIAAEVFKAGEELEALRVAALQQAMATRQQRLARCSEQR